MQTRLNWNKMENEMNPTNINAGTKIHLIKYVGVKVNEENGVYVKPFVNTMGPKYTSCAMTKDAENIKSFWAFYKRNPDCVCKKCLVRAKELLKEAKEKQEQK